MHSVACSGSSIKNLLVVSIKISLYTPRMSLSFIGFSIISRFFSIRFSRYDLFRFVLTNREQQSHVSELRLLSWFSLENDDSNLSKRVASCELYLSVYHSLMGLSGLEPPTSRLSGVRSNLLSYKPLNLATTCSPIPSPV